MKWFILSVNSSWAFSLLMLHEDSPPTPPSPSRGEGKGGGGNYFLSAILLMYLFICPMLVFAGQFSVKILIQESGSYSIASTELEAAGLSLVGLDPQTLEITNRGNLIPIQIQNWEGGGFEVVFYATGISRSLPEFEFTDTNVYWLSAGGENGLRMKEKPIILGETVTPASFLVTLHLETDLTYSITTFTTGESDHWFWNELPDPSKDPPEQLPVTRKFTFTINNFDPNKEIAVRTSLQGETALGHHTRVSVNDCIADDDQWTGQIQQIHDGRVSATCLHEGENTLALESLGDYNATVDGDRIDRIFLNWFEIDYWHTYVAENDYLEFTGLGAGGNFTFQISGFSQDTVEVFDITDPHGVMRISNSTLSGTTTFADTLAQGETRRYIALNSSKRKKPLKMILDTPSNLRDAANGADYLIITHEDFSDSILPLAIYRRQQGLRVAIAKITDVYDEFRDGIFNPNAIKDFLSYAFDHWQPPAPLYVLLVGDATVDYKDNYKTGSRNFIPALFSDILSIQVPSDNQFVTIKGDDPIPEMFIGRLPVRTREEADSLVSKIIVYETRPPFNVSSTNAPFLFVADLDDPLAGKFQDLSKKLGGILSDAGYEVGLALARVGDLRPSVMRSINNGVPIATYTGHGNAFQWSSQGILAVEPPKNDVAALENGLRQPLIIALSCLNNYFVFPGLSSLGEVFVRANGKGAIAYWSGTGLGFSADHDVVATEFFNQLASGKDIILGAITNTAIKPVIEAKISEGIVKQLVLLGDPALKLSLPKIPQSSPPSSDGGSATPGEQGSGGCFIATATYGSPIAPQVQLLREFRDHYLLTYEVGKRIVALYYAFSPPLAEFISRHEALRAGVQIGLLPVLGFAFLTVKTTASMKLFLLVGGLFILAWRIRK